MNAGSLMLNERDYMHGVEKQSQKVMDMLIGEEDSSWHKAEIHIDLLLH